MIEKGYFLEDDDNNKSIYLLGKLLVRRYNAERVHLGGENRFKKYGCRQLSYIDFYIDIESFRCGIDWNFLFGITHLCGQCSFSELNKQALRRFPR